MGDVIFTIICGLLSGIFIIYWGYIIYDTKKFRFKFKWYHIFILVIFSILFYISVGHFSHFLHSGYFLFVTLLMHQLFFPICFSKICAGAFIVNLIRYIVIILGTIIHNHAFCDHYYLSSILLNIIVTVIILLCRRLLKNHVDTYAIYNNKSWNSIIISCFFIVIILIFQTSTNIISEGPLILFPLCCLGYLLYSVYKFTCQKVTLHTYLTNYYEIFTFSRFMEDIIDNYKIKLYDTRDQLNEIKYMVGNKNKKMNNYINGLIEEKSHIDYSWLTGLSYFKIPGIKGFISYKIEEMKSLGIEVELFFSDSLSEVDIIFTEYDLKNLYVIIGTWCDNAIEAAVISVDKTITFQAYYDNGLIHFLIANTYDKVISLRDIDDFGVSGHKSGCGTGLYTVSTIIQNSHNLTKNTSIIDDFFIQELVINTNMMKNITKN